MHPLLKPYNLFCSNGVAILSGFRDIPLFIRPVEVNNDRWAAILNFFDLKFFEMNPLLKPYNLFYSNGVSIFSGFHNIPQNISAGFTDVIN